VAQVVKAEVLEKRDYLTQVPNAAYFLTAVRNNSLRRRLYAWARYVTAVGPGMLIIIEAMTHPSRTRRPDNTVRLPEPCGVTTPSLC